MSKLYREYIKSYKLSKENSDGFLEKFEELIATPEVQLLKEYEQHLEIDRLQHVLSVSYLAYKISKKLGKDVRSTTRAAIMHDLVYYDWREGETEGWHRPHGYKHPRYAALNARELCKDLTDKEECAIRTHMWPLTLTPPKSTEGWIVVFCDKYCATWEVIYSLVPSYKNRFASKVEGI